jgi:hypothetical protein
VRAALYARVSTERQADRGTIGSQLVLLREHIVAVGDELVGEYVDDGQSGARLTDPAWTRCHDQDGPAEQPWKPRWWQVGILAHRGLYSLPAPDCQHRQKAAAGSEQHAEGMPHSRDSECRNELNDGNATGDERERGADPGEEGSLIGEREAVIRLLLVAGRRRRSFVIGRFHVHTSPSSARISTVASPRRAGDSTRPGWASTECSR